MVNVVKTFLAIHPPRSFMMTRNFANWTEKLCSKGSKNLLMRVVT